MVNILKTHRRLLIAQRIFWGMAICMLSSNAWALNPWLVTKTCRESEVNHGTFAATELRVTKTGCWGRLYANDFLVGSMSFKYKADLEAWVTYHAGYIEESRNTGIPIEIHTNDVLHYFNLRLVEPTQKQRDLDSWWFTVTSVPTLKIECDPDQNAAPAPAPAPPEFRGVIIDPYNKDVNPFIKNQPAPPRKTPDPEKFKPKPSDQGPPVAPVPNPFRVPDRQ